ncbi:hypothetical protein R3P38DRAFT_2902971 [Favolaschia claudopus]|uniref:Proteophosphoglycan 5 n=1 Tax=Favolaschia claudopus TaxID=2862362 RepID=A0AAW0CN18_9AGAR
MSSMPSPTLPPAQRLRLMRSTRKLGALLGETPRVQLSAASPPPSAFSSGKQLLRRRSSTRPLSLSLSPTRAQDEPPDMQPMLLVHLPPLTSPRPRRSSSSSSASATPTQTPLSPSFSVSLNSPVTPTFGADSAEENAGTKRRRLAKLTRILGENVPPELVVSSASTHPQSRGGAGKARRRASTLGLGISSTSPRSRASTLSSPPSSPLYIDGDDDEEHRHLLNAHPRLSLTPPPVATHREGKGWSGEWSYARNGGISSADATKEDMRIEDVRRQLRGLKVA